jgi:hypothetical protein
MLKIVAMVDFGHRHLLSLATYQGIKYVVHSLLPGDGVTGGSGSDTRPEWEELRPITVGWGDDSASAQNCGFVRPTEDIERVRRDTDGGLGPGMICT